MAEVPGTAFSSFQELHVGAAVPENIIINANSTIQYEFSSKIVIVIVMIMEYF